jgi:hypothetical protein
MFMLASSPIENTAIQADISGKLPGNLRQAPQQGKRGSHPLVVSKGPFPYGNSGDVGNRVVGEWQVGMPRPTRGSGLRLRRRLRRLHGSDCHSCRRKKPQARIDGTNA